jgi:hypothetical protein
VSLFHVRSASARPQEIIQAKSSKTFEQVPEGDAERVSYAREMTERRIPDPLLDAPHIGAVHSGLLGQVFLRPAL